MAKLLRGGLLVALCMAVAGQTPSQLPIFSDVTAKAGFRFRHEASRTSQKYLIEAMGSGVAWLDYDGDGNLDLFFVNGAALADPMRKGKPPDKTGPRCRRAG